MQLMLFHVSVQLAMTTAASFADGCVGLFGLCCVAYGQLF